jgi:hypothetical protein
MRPTPKIISLADLKTGDFFLHYSADTNFFSRRIRATCKSDYTHASIYLGDELIAEAIVSGVQRVKLVKRSRKKGHIAVFRTTNFQREDTKALNDFIKRLLRIRTAYKWWVLPHFVSRRDEHFSSILEKLDKHFKTKPKRKWFITRQAYFCSGLVLACYVAIGVIGKDAAVWFDPDFFSPIDLVRTDIGIFVGYLKSPDYELPADDEFILWGPNSWGEIRYPG